MKLSIIIPIYNVKDYVIRAIESALSQKIDSFEVILVDDGSTDGCYDICEKYRSNPRISIIHKLNGGLVDARKAGVDFAKGMYIAFLDGDDWVEESYYSNMVNSQYFGEADIICSGYTSDFGGVRNNEIHENYIAAGLYKGSGIYNIKSQVLYSGRYYEYGIIPTVWSKIFKSELLKKWIFKIPNGITVGEDVACTMPYLLDSSCIEINNFNTGYHYRCTGGSMSRSFPQKRVNEVNSMLKYLYNTLSSFEIWNSIGRQYYVYASFLIKHVIKGTAITMDTETLREFTNDGFVEKCISLCSTEKMIPLRYRVMYIMMNKKCLGMTLNYYRTINKIRRK